MISLMYLLIALSTVSIASEMVDNPIELDPVIVTAKREPIRLSRTINSAISLTPTQIEQSGSNNILSRISRLSAGISITSVNGSGYGLGKAGHGKLLIRGLGFSPNTGSLVLIDGRPDIAGLFGHPLPDMYRRAGLYSAELVKGGASTLYGSNAIAGVMDLHSFYRPDKVQYTNLELQGGSFNTLNGIIQHSQKIGNSFIAGWYDYIESDNHRDNSNYANRSGGLKWKYTPNAQLSVFAAGRYSVFDFADAGPVYNPIPSSGDALRSGLTFGMDYSKDKHSLYFRAYNSYGEHKFSDGFKSVDRNNGATLFARIKGLGSDAFSLSGGLSFNLLGGSAENGTSFVKSGNFHESEFSGHIQGEYSLSFAEITMGGRYISHERYDNHIVYQGGVALFPANIGTIKLLAGTAYRNPTINESQLFLISNADSLSPEEGVFYEIGYFNSISKRMSLEFAAFWRTGDNLIATRPNSQSPPPVLYQNGGSYKHSGFEMTARYSSGNWFLSPSFMHLNQKEFNSSVPEDKFALTAFFRNKKLQIGIHASASFGMHADSAGSSIELADYSITSINGSYLVAEDLKFVFRLDNIFDTEYQIVHGYPMPGIAIRTGFTYLLSNK